MKPQTAAFRWLSGTLAAVCAAILAGCATQGYEQADQTGKAINTFRNDISNIKVAVNESVRALDQLEATATTDPRNAFKNFSASVDKVDKAGQVAKKHADDMREQGQAYFQKWQEQLQSVKNEDIKKLAIERKAKLQESFDSIRTTAQD